jgi:hypothetical protein
LTTDTDGNVFGGFTPVEWESPSEWKGDDSLRNFLFTLRNPRGVAPRKFALRVERKQAAILCYSECCAAFGGDLRVCDNCSANRDSYTLIGGDRTYANDTAFEYFFTGAQNFTVKEIEVFTIADSTTFPADLKNARMGVHSKRWR